MMYWIFLGCWLVILAVGGFGVIVATGTRWKPRQIGAAAVVLPLVTLAGMWAVVHGLGAAL